MKSTIGDADDDADGGDDDNDDDDETMMMIKIRTGPVSGTNGEG